jgi:acyl-CoA thioesterase I
MIIMRRIILALLTVTLSGCTAQPDDASARASEDDRSRAPATAESRAHAGEAASASDGAATGNAATTVEPEDVRSILFVGTSLTAGYGIGADLAYPSVVQQLIDSAGLPYRVVNAGISGETSAGGLRRIDWSLQQPADVLVLELGANDALRGLDPAAMRSNLDAIIRRALATYPDMAIVIAGMEAPPNLGEDYGRRFRRVFSDLAREHDAALVPFLLEGVAAVPSLNIEDGIHPNAAGHRIIGRTVWSVLRPVLRERTRS